MSQILIRWPTMSGEQQTACIEAISMIVKQTAAIGFPAYGSIYVTDVPHGSGLTLLLAQSFCIGPHAEPGIGTAMLAKRDTTIGRSLTEALMSSVRFRFTFIVCLLSGLSRVSA